MMTLQNGLCISEMLNDELRLQHIGYVLSHCGTVNRMWFKVTEQSLMVVKTNQVIKLSAID